MPEIWDRLYPGGGWFAANLRYVITMVRKSARDSRLVSPSLSPDEENDVFDVGGVGEHIDRLDLSNQITFIHHLQISCLGRRIA